MANPASPVARGYVPSAKRMEAPARTARAGQLLGLQGNRVLLPGAVLDRPLTGRARGCVPLPHGGNGELARYECRRCRTPSPSSSAPRTRVDGTISAHIIYTPENTQAPHLRTDYAREHSFEGALCRTTFAVRFTRRITTSISLGDGIVGLHGRKRRSERSGESTAGTLQDAEQLRELGQPDEPPGITSEEVTISGRHSHRAGVRFAIPPRTSTTAATAMPPWEISRSCC